MNSCFRLFFPQFCITDGSVVVEFHCIETMFIRALAQIQFLEHVQNVAEAHFDEIIDEDKLGSVCLVCLKPPANISLAVQSAPSSFL